MAASTSNKRPEDKETFCAARCAAAGEMADRNVETTSKLAQTVTCLMFAARMQIGTVAVLYTYS